MARVFCVEWSEDNETFGAREAGWTLHLSREDAETYIREGSSPHFGHDRPYAVEVPQEVYEEVRRTPQVVFQSIPRECPYRPVREDPDPVEGSP